MPQLPYPSQIQGGNMPGLQFYLSSYCKRTVLLKRLLRACLFSLCLSALPLNARTNRAAPDRSEQMRYWWVNQSQTHRQEVGTVIFGRLSAEHQPLSWAC